ncbi:MAG: autotransporter outer membrane beta-barrel domain-containing protein [Rhizobiales bacterium]|nr:autotransporter outer membrane beta-barrel domain-containing protein [Hyphomicrobiales bacterium]
MTAFIPESPTKFAHRLLFKAAAAAAFVLGIQASAFAACGPAPLGSVNATAAAPIGPSAVTSFISVVNTANTAFLTQSSAFVASPATNNVDQTGGGIWTRSVVGQTDTTLSSNFNASLGGLSASANCQTTTKQTFAGFQAGADIAKLNLGGDAGDITLGATGGYYEMRAREANGTFGAQFNIPFAGVYAAYTRGGLFADAQVRWEFYDTYLTDPQNGLTNQSFSARGNSFAANLGYNFALPNNWFI